MYIHFRVILFTMTTRPTLRVLIPDIGMVLDVPYVSEVDTVYTFMLRIASMAKKQYSPILYPPDEGKSLITSHASLEVYLEHANLMLESDYVFSFDQPIKYVLWLVQEDPSKQVMLKLIDRDDYCIACRQ